MDCEKIGKLIYHLRKEKNLTQQKLAEYINVSDKTISKWERGLGCPDVSLLPMLSNIFDINLENLLAGELDFNPLAGGNMKKMKFYVCPFCGNLVTATAKTTIFCCGKKLLELKAQKAIETEKLTAEKIEEELFVSTTHEMSKQHYITFVALLTGDSLLLRKQYPQWNLQAYFPYCKHGMLVWHCCNHGLFYQTF